MFATLVSRAISIAITSRPLHLTQHHHVRSRRINKLGEASEPEVNDRPTISFELVLGAVICRAPAGREGSPYECQHSELRDPPPQDFPNTRYVVILADKFRTIREVRTLRRE